MLDLTKWDALLYTNTILSESRRREMWTPVQRNDGTPDPYGFGWHVDMLGGRRWVWHGGGLPGFASQFARFVDDGVTVVVLTNGNNADLVGLAARVALFYLPTTTR